jgi:hypothetical protein
MTMHSEHSHQSGFFEQLLLIGAATIVLLVFAWTYVG